MKKIYLTLLVAATISSVSKAQVCANGRYANDVYATVSSTTGIQYGSNKALNGSTQSLTLDFYEGQGDTAHFRPLIIWVHGGSFIGGTSTDADVLSLSQHFAKKGYACASINYRLGFSPFDSTGVIPALLRAVQDTKAAIRFFYKDRSTTNTYKIDTNNIFIGGSSAGAITVLHTAYLNKTCEINQYMTQSALDAMGGIDGASGNQCYSTKVKGVINLCGALGKYGWFETGDVPLCSMHGTADGVVTYSQGKANPGIPIMYLDGSRMIYEQSLSNGVSNTFYTFNGAGHVPYAGSSASQLAYMDTTVNFVRDYLLTRLGCSDAPLQAPNTPYGTATLYAYTTCTTNVISPCDVSVKEMQAELVSEIYPNPSSHDVKVTFNNSGNKCQVSLYDLTGKVIRSVTTTDASMVIERNNLDAGIYFIKVMDSLGRSTTKKLIFN